LAKFGAMIVGGKNDIKISVLNPPKIQFGDKQTLPVDVSSSFRSFFEEIILYK
jgi:predicted neuraminidase